MEPRIITITSEEVVNTGVRRVTAVIGCQKCDRRFPFIFNESDADIHARYMAEDIARTYVRRCAPLLCSSCALHLPPSVGEGKTL